MPGAARQFYLQVGAPRIINGEVVVVTEVVVSF